MMHTHNHERTAMAREIFSRLDEGHRRGHGGEAEAPRRDGAGAGIPAVIGGAAPAGRCRVKGCIYPATEIELGLCIRHVHQEEEPQFFQSRQPSLRVLETAKYGMTTEHEDGRIRRKLNKIEQRQAFLKGVL